MKTKTDKDKRVKTTLRSGRRIKLGLGWSGLGLGLGLRVGLRLGLRMGLGLGLGLGCG